MLYWGGKVKQYLLSGLKLHNPLPEASDEDLGSYYTLKDEAAGMQMLAEFLETKRFKCRQYTEKIKASKQWLVKKATKEDKKVFGKLKLVLSQHEIEEAVNKRKKKKKEEEEEDEDDDGDGDGDDGDGDGDDDVDEGGKNDEDADSEKNYQGNSRRAWFGWKGQKGWTTGC